LNSKFISSFFLLPRVVRRHAIHWREREKSETRQNLIKTGSGRIRIGTEKKSLISSLTLFFPPSPFIFFVTLFSLHFFLADKVSSRKIRKMEFDGENLNLYHDQLKEKVDYNLEDI
jgi:hypothetical protein